MEGLTLQGKKGFSSCAVLYTLQSSGVFVHFSGVLTQSGTHVFKQLFSFELL